MAQKAMKSLVLAILVVGKTKKNRATRATASPVTPAIDKSAMLYFARNVGSSVLLAMDAILLPRRDRILTQDLVSEGV